MCVVVCEVVVYGSVWVWCVGISVYRVVRLWFVGCGCEWCRCGCGW